MKTPTEKAREQAATLENIPRAFPGGETTLFPIESVSAGIGAARVLVGVFKIFAYWLARGIIAPCEIVLRYHFGERYYNPLVILSLWTLLFSANRLLSANGTVLVWLGVIASLGIGVNGILCFLRDRKGGYWHSFSEGESRFRIVELDAFLAKWHFTFDASKIFLEPALLILIGGTFSIFAFSREYWHFSEAIVTLPSYLVLAGATMFLYQLSLWRDRREELLNEKDSQIDAEVKFAARQPTAKPTLSTHRGVAYIPPARQWPQGQAARKETAAPPPTPTTREQVPSRPHVIPESSPARTAVAPISSAPKPQAEAPRPAAEKIIEPILPAPEIPALATPRPISMSVAVEAIRSEAAREETKAEFVAPDIAPPPSPPNTQFDEAPREFDVGREELERMHDLSQSLIAEAAAREATDRILREGPSAFVTPAIKPPEPRDQPEAFTAPHIEPPADAPRAKPKKRH